MLSGRPTPAYVVGMARKLRLEYPGAIYHVWFRGNNRRRLFADDEDRKRLLRSVGERVEEYEVRLYCYQLMSNHVHLVFETPRANLSVFMHALLTSYSIYYNHRHRETGHLIDGRFGDKLVEGDEYLGKLCRYVHLNPLETRKARALELPERRKLLRNYPWSSYRAYIGQVKKPEWLDADPLWKMLARSRKTQKAEYRRYVELGLAQSDDEFETLMNSSKLGIGSDWFVDLLDEKYQTLLEGRAVKEDASFRRMLKPVESERILGVVADEMDVEMSVFTVRRRGCRLRGMGARMLIKYGGLSQREVANLFGGMTGSGVSQHLASLKKAEKESRDLRRRLARIEKKLDVLRD